MGTTVKQGIVQLIYATFLHNSQVLALSFGLVMTLILLFKKPKRLYLFFFLGFAFLIAHFEYLKHIVDPLQKQTVGVVITEEGFSRTRRWIDLFFNDIVPLAMYLIGWGSIFIGIFLTGNEKKKKKRR